ncbi:MAG TPA: carboxypeptidase M32 [Herpetosiphonaceae bacterium]
MSEALQTLKERLATVTDLNRAASVLSWDQRTYMPSGGAAARAHQVATLRRLAHEYFTADEIGRLLDEAAPLAADEQDESDDACLVRYVRREYEQDRKLPSEFVRARAQAASLANQAWEEARRKSDFTRFQPYLEKMFDFAKREADYLGYDEHPYDALLDQYEPGMSTAQVRVVFDELKAGTVPLLKAIMASSTQIDDSILHQEFDEARQEQFGVEITRAFGYDWSRGRQDRTVHPFYTNFDQGDVRITTRFYPDFLNPALFGTMHEAGHAMYEQGVDPALNRTPLSGGASLGVHESQSRLWENLVGRSRPFWQANYGRLQELFPAQFGQVDFDVFYRAINNVQPSFIRVEADELTYNLHIMLRFELETAVLEGKMQVGDLAEEWQSRMESLLGITPPDDAQGVLQDMHWSSGLIGYFPTYTLGNVLSVQLWESALGAHPSIPEEIARNEYATLLGWLRQNIHRHGRKFKPNTLIQKATGGSLDAKPYLNYLRAKFGEIYGVSV